MEKSNFECANCHTQFDTLEGLHYIAPDGYRLCDKCFKKFKSIPNKVREAMLEANEEQS